MSKEHRWVLSRAGVFNYWYYDEEYFDFYEGRMLIRGPNGSGKSVTMQSFITLLLDGNYHPSRLDSFGSNARKLEDYVLGEQDISGKNESTAYLFLEFKKENIFVSIGMGMRAKRGSGVDCWYFVLTDNRRFGIDIFFYEKINGQKIPLTRRKFENLIGSGGKVFTSRRDYMQEVNKILFGFENVEDFENLIDLIIRVRAPKLSRDIKPDRICTILQESLPALSESDLRSLSESIENMDKIQTELKNLETIQSCLEKIKRAYDEYNRFLMYQRISELIESHKKLTKATKEYEMLLGDVQKLTDMELKLRNSLDSIEKEEQALKFRLESIKESDIFKLQQRYVELNAEIEDLENQKTLKLSSLNDHMQRLSQADADIKRTKHQLLNSQNLIKDYIEQSKKLLESLNMQRFSDVLDIFEKGEQKSLDIIKNELARSVAEVEKALKNYDTLQDVQKDLDVQLRKLDRSKNELQKYQDELNLLILQLEDAKNLLKSKIKSYFDQNQVLKAELDDITLMFQLINTISQKGEYEGVKKILNDVYSRHYLSISDNLRKLEFEMNLLKEKIKDKKKKIEEIQSQKDEFIPSSEKQKKVRQRLLEKGVPFVPFYMAVDFKPGIDERLKAVIEDALFELGVLNALIVPEKYKNEIDELLEDEKEVVLFPKPAYFSHTLNEYLEVANFENAEGLINEVAAVIDSIHINPVDDGIYVCEDGRFGNGILKGKTTTHEQPKYIGIENRRRYKQMLILQLEEEIQNLTKELEEKKAEANFLKSQLEVLELEKKNFPTSADLDTAFDMIDGVEKNISKLQIEIEALEERIKELTNKQNLLKYEISLIATKLSLPSSKEVFAKAKQDANALSSLLLRLETEALHKQEVERTYQSLNRLYEQIRESVDTLNGDVHRISEKLEVLKLHKEEIEKRLSSEDAQRLFDEQRRAFERLENIPAERKKLNEELFKVTSQKAAAEQKLEFSKQELQSIESEYKLALAAFKIELGFGFVFKGIEFEDDQKLLEFARSKEGELKEYSQKDFSSIFQKLMSIHYTTQIQLAEFGADLVDWKDDKTTYKRYLWTCRKEGRFLSLYQFMDEIAAEIAEKKNLITESERELFEEVLAKNIGFKISRKIMLAQDWVKRMNELMANLSTSSGLTFRLSWEQKRQETEDELSTGELVKLLSKDPLAATDEDRNKIAMHFRSRIEKAKKYQENPENFATLYEIIKEILDYRQWFEFRLYYQKVGESRKELTNNAFDKFSGGEKALSIYVPLLAALCAKYQSAANFAPRIIALDEAFAGVDENNIENMFDLIEKLEFDYIMNSQVLWGDYKTVPGLCIYELLRENNQPSVLKVKYVWNGYKKVLVEV
ncbi:TIGR02680 family protein [Caldicellulosiruptor changbaiensis]|uniref:TIGR02680 family protein n=1 Tax=Caldicellulosiruptor changbaiensis TaxID=1222016 RepID=A0A3T0D257_9FIRM|nr:TIGR02680 family protein [Caldicellulosiruptor changbaiensis]AZT89341.1 TIGR02680 family protein [Caldicellulosiruptor changbaiensis]